MIELFEVFCLVSSTAILATNVKKKWQSYIIGIFAGIAMFLILKVN